MTPLSIPKSVTFPEAIALTQTLLAQIAANQLNEAEIEAIVSALVKRENGARGFFVTYLTDERSLADSPPQAIIRALQTSPAIVSDLLVKNVAMSAAMAVTHRRNHNESMEHSSRRVTRRTATLIEQLKLTPVSSQLKQLQESLATESGDYQAFLQRWGYDSEQRQAIQNALTTYRL
ncbi:MAG: hypothetical protein ACFB4I_07135 [Cyanophyceae cyanobacterium]